MGKFRYLVAASAMVLAGVGVVAPSAEAKPPPKVVVKPPLPTPACADLATIEIEYWSSSTIAPQHRSITPLLTGFGCSGDVLDVVVDGVRQSAPLDGSTRGVTFNQDLTGPTSACVFAEVTRTTSFNKNRDITQVLDRLPDTGCLAVDVPAPAPAGCRLVVGGGDASVDVAAPSCPDVTYSLLYQAGTDFAAPVIPVVAAGAVAGVSGADPVVVPTDPVPVAVPNVSALWRASQSQSLGGNESARFVHSGQANIVRPAPEACADLTTLELDYLDPENAQFERNLIVSALLAGEACPGDQLTLYAHDSFFPSVLFDGPLEQCTDTSHGFNPPECNTFIELGATLLIPYLDQADPRCVVVELTRGTQLLDRLPDRGCIATPEPAVEDAAVVPTCRQVVPHFNGPTQVDILTPSCPDVTYSLALHEGRFALFNRPSTISAAGAITGVSGQDPVVVPANPFPEAPSNNGAACDTSSSSSQECRSAWGYWRSSRAESVGGGETVRFVYSGEGRFVYGRILCTGCVGGRFR